MRRSRAVLEKDMRSAKERFSRIVDDIRKNDEKVMKRRARGADNRSLEDKERMSAERFRELFRHVQVRRV